MYVFGTSIPSGNGEHVFSFNLMLVNYVNFSFVAKSVSVLELDRCYFLATSLCLHKHVTLIKVPVWLSRTNMRICIICFT
ncbi:hypothetical protein QVD17_16733 [Tagetes erecta]|uniref:Uncharacterized protein n=1 Tax=Tagetes erecta TaxID=13708 RepID=A0AAD8KYA6_TARER|nr:hypothetical protein QVD17_16733 [Tagetes erecta]